MDLPLEDFKRLVAESLDLVPEEFRAYLENVRIVIEDEPRGELLRELRVHRGHTLFGLYSGTPMTVRTHDHVGLPDQITLFRGPLLEECEDLEELRVEVAKTVLHEVAHHFGIGEARLIELGWG